MTGTTQGTYAANFLILGKMWSDFFFLPPVCYLTHFSLLPYVAKDISVVITIKP